MGRRREQRRLGALIGLAVGDALGAAVEFEPRGSFEPVTGFRGGGPHGIAAGEWTDDTSMALALADSLALCGFDLADQAQRYLAWWRQGKYSVNGRCFDIGNATREALARIERGADAASAGDTADHTSGNGSIMRLAPIPIHYLDLYPGNVPALSIHAAKSSLTTHGSPKCRSACAYLALVLAALMSGRDRDEVLAPDFPELDEIRDQLDPSVLAVARGSYRNQPADRIRGSGYVVESLEAALWAFHDAPSFADAVLRAVNLGDDSDTTGAVCGQLAGACFGVDGIPREWLDGLAKREWLEDAVRRLGSHDTPRLSLAEAHHAPPATHCYWVVPGRLLAGAYPEGERVKAIVDAGIRTIVSLLEDPEQCELASDIRSIRLPIPDFSVTSQAGMRAILDAIDDSIAARQPVYVHCLGGVGRTGTVIGCWLRRHRLATRDTVLDLLARLRRADRERAHLTSPETPAQREMVLGWAE